jgi:hypothetical protein
MRAIRFARRRPGTVAVAIFAALLAWDGSPGQAALTAAALALVILLDLIRARLGTDLDRAAARDLLNAITRVPPGTVLVDRDTDDVLIPQSRRTLGQRTWIVEHCAGGWRALDSAYSDLHAGLPSTISYTDYVMGGRRISAIDHVSVVTLDPDGILEIDDSQPRGSVWRVLPFRVRTGICRMSERQVADLTAQLERAEVLA